MTVKDRLAIEQKKIVYEIYLSIHPSIHPSIYLSILNGLLLYKLFQKCPFLNLI